MKPRHLLLVAAGILLPQSAISAVLSHDSFEIGAGAYSAGELASDDAPVVSQNPTVAGYTGGWLNPSDGQAFGNQEPAVTAGTLVYGDALYAGSSGGKVSVPFNNTGGEITVNNSGRVVRVLDSTLSSGTGTGLTATNASAGTVYLSFLFQSGQQSGATTYQMLSLYNTTTSDANRNFDIGITTNGGQTGTSFNFGLDNAYTSTGVAANTTVNLLVVRFDLSAAAASDSATVWVNPTLGGVGDPTGGVTVSGKDLTWDRLALSDYDSNSAAWDEIRWGTDFQSVTVPEPSAALLGGLGMLALLRRRRN